MKTEGAKLGDETRPAADATVDDTELYVSVGIGKSPPATKETLKSEEELSIEAVLNGMARFAAVTAWIDDAGYTVKVVLLAAS